MLLLAATATAQIPPRSISAPKEEVDDNFLAYLHGLLYNDAELHIDGERLPREFPEFVPTRPTPFNDITLFTRTRAALIADGSGAHSRLSIEFSVPLRYEVPLDILGAHPVELQGSRVIVFEELLRPPGSSAVQSGSAAESPEIVGVIPADVGQVILLTLRSGYLRVDFAPWLDFIGGSILEDVDVTLIAVVRYRDRWYALLGGYTPDDRPMTGILDMSTSRFLVSPPRLLTRLARDLVLSATSR